MDFDDLGMKPSNSALNLEKSLYELIKNYQESYRGAKKSGVINKGFYFYFLRNRQRLGYDLGSGTFSELFSNIFKNQGKFTNLLKAWSAKFNRYLKGSEEVIKKLEENPEYVIELVTLGNQLSVADFVVLTEGLSDRQLLEILRGKDHIDKMIESVKVENEISKKIYQIDK